MYFKQFLDERCGCASYLVASRKTHEAAVVDPALQIEPYQQLLAERAFVLRYVIDTHVHADHVSGARKLASTYGAEVCLHEAAGVAFPFRPLKDSEELPLGQLRLRVLHTPGHRPELISVLIINPERSPEPSMVLTGDSLLVGDVGRPDFGGGDAAAQYESVGRLLRLPDWVAVFPGHFEGPCGKGMCGRPSTTIGFERLFNPLIRLRREEFIGQLTDGIPARPLNMTAIEATNRGLMNAEWAMLMTLGEVREAMIDELRDALPGATLVDVREPEEFVTGHVPGAVNIPQADLASRLDELKRDELLFVICHAGYRSLRASQFLRQAGFDRVATVVGGTEAWRVRGYPLQLGTTETPARRIVETEWAHAGAGLHGR
jgi:glyoxylase-like metal-dependent hydrolase (beta-lactamase superfamily II)/rhodanese-related sulfurtransferase